MRHFRGSRGMRRSNGPRPIVRTAKYIVVDGPATEGAGLTVIGLVSGTDNAVLGQTGVTDITVPVGARITSMEIFMPKVNLGAGTANFITWTIQHINTGQAIVNPVTAGGNPLRKNIILTGKIGLGAGQNNSLHIKFRVPKKFQRIADGDLWQLVNNNFLAVSADYYIIYKVQM